MLSKTLPRLAEYLHSLPATALYYVYNYFPGNRYFLVYLIVKESFLFDHPGIWQAHSDRVSWNGGHFSVGGCSELRGAFFDSLHTPLSPSQTRFPYGLEPRFPHDEVSESWILTMV